MLLRSVARVLFAALIVSVWLIERNSCIHHLHAGDGKQKHKLRSSKRRERKNRFSTLRICKANESSINLLQLRCGCGSDGRTKARTEISLVLIESPNYLMRLWLLLSSQSSRKCANKSDAFKYKLMNINLESINTVRYLAFVLRVDEFKIPPQIVFSRDEWLAESLAIDRCNSNSFCFFFASLFARRSSIDWWRLSRTRRGGRRWRWWWWKCHYRCWRLQNATDFDYIASAVFTPQRQQWQQQQQQ